METLKETLLIVSGNKISIVTVEINIIASKKRKSRANHWIWLYCFQLHDQGIKGRI